MIEFPLLSIFLPCNTAWICFSCCFDLFLQQLSLSYTSSQLPPNFIRIQQQIMQQKIRLEPEDQLYHEHSCYLHKAQMYSKLFHPISYMVHAVHNCTVNCVNMHNIEDIPPQAFVIFSTIFNSIFLQFSIFIFLYFSFQQPQLKGNYKQQNNTCVPFQVHIPEHTLTVSLFNLFLWDKKSNIICILFYRHQKSKQQKTNST